MACSTCQQSEKPVLCNPAHEGLRPSACCCECWKAWHNEAVMLGSPHLHAARQRLLREPRFAELNYFRVSQWYGIVVQ